MAVSRRTAIILGVIPALLLTGFLVVRTLFTPPDDLDLSTSLPTEAGRYLVDLTPNDGAPTIGPFGRWTILVRSAAGDPIEGADVLIEGGMPQHGHGLPTAPRVTRQLGQGGYLVEVVKFSMTGWWTFTVRVDGSLGRDEATFNVLL